MSPPERMLVVLFPHWPIVARPEARDLAGAVVERQRVVAVSRVARTHGVHVGQRQQEAERLSPGMHFFQRDPGGEFHAFTPIVETLSAMVPDLVVREPGWIGLPTRGPARYFGGEHALIA